MLSRITVSLILMAAIAVISEKATTAACFLVNSQSQKACVSACCAKKPCCETSQKRAGDPAQPFSTTNSLQKNSVALKAVVMAGKVRQPRALEISYPSFAEHSWHSPETLAFLCIRVI